MIKNVYVINSESYYYWMPNEEEALKFIEKIEKEDNQKDIRFTYSRCEINDKDNDDFKELEVLEIFRD